MTDRAGRADPAHTADPARTADPAHIADPAHTAEGASPRVGRGPVFAGLAAGLFVAVLGNLDGLVQLLDGFWKSSGSTFTSSLPGVSGLWSSLAGLYQVLVGGKTLPAFDFWRSSRMMPPTPNITEFPYFTFLFADLHAHLIALPFTLLALGLALTVIYQGWRQGLARKVLVSVAAPTVRPRPQPRPERPVAAARAGAPRSLLELALAAPPRVVAEAPPAAFERPELSAPAEPARAAVAAPPESLRDLLRLIDPASLVAASLVLGALRVINSWDFPTYLLLTAGSLLIGSYLARRRVDAILVADVVFKSLLVYLLSTILFLPFHQSFQLWYSGVEASRERTPIHQYLGVHGFFLACIGSLVLVQLVGALRGSKPWRLGALVLRHWERLPRLVRLYRRLIPVEQSPAGRWVAAISLAALLALLAFGLYLFAFLVALLGALGGLGLVALRRRESEQAALLFVLLMTAVALALGLGVDLITIQGDVGRMNTVFKFYLQAWVLLAVAAAFAAWWLARHVVERGLAGLGSAQRLWMAGLGFLFLSSLVYPLAATPVRLRDRFESTPPTLDGTAYMQGAEYQEEKGRFALKWDADGIRWLQDNVQGSPVVLEASTPLYRWGSRVSVYTGLPTVVGWDWHQKQQRWGHQSAVDGRKADVQSIYSTPNPDQAAGLLRKYDVRYIYVGEVERLYYPAQGLAKFDAMVGRQLRLVYQNEKVRIYEVVS